MPRKKRNIMQTNDEVERMTPLQAKKALIDMDREFIEDAYDLLGRPPDLIPAPRTVMQKLLQSIYHRAIDPEDKTSHQFAKLLMERVIPQRKQVEHLGEADARRLGVNINILTDKANEHEQSGTTIEHEPINGRESSGTEH